MKCFLAKVIPARKEKIKQWEIEENQRQTDFVAMKQESECPSGKICYKSKVDAEYALYTAGHSRSVNRREKLVYFCKLCNSFHLSSHDQLPSWRDRNRPNNHNLSKPCRYIPAPRQENWETEEI